MKYITRDYSRNIFIQHQDTVNTNNHIALNVALDLAIVKNLTENKGITK